jgi:hypothetical protein
MVLSFPLLLYKTALSTARGTILKNLLKDKWLASSEIFSFFSVLFHFILVSQTLLEAYEKRHERTRGHGWGQENR